jgi:hypothetical protein
MSGGWGEKGWTPSGLCGIELFLVVLGFELRVSCLLCKHSYHMTHSASGSFFFFVMGYFAK